MGIQALTPPSRERTSKYAFSDEDVKMAVKMLNEGQHPGEGGYEKEGQARSAASCLIEQCERVEGAPEQIGSRAWQDDKGKWFFTLKIGKRAPNHSNGKAA